MTTMQDDGANEDDSHLRQLPPCFSATATQLRHFQLTMFTYHQTGNFFRCFPRQLETSTMFFTSLCYTQQLDAHDHSRRFTNYVYIYIHLRRGRTKASCFSDGGCTAEVGDRRGSCIQRRFGRRYRARSMRRFWRRFGSRFQSRQGSRGGCGQRRGYWGLSLGLCH